MPLILLIDDPSYKSNDPVIGVGQRDAVSVQVEDGEALLRKERGASFAEVVNVYARTNIISV